MFSPLGCLRCCPSFLEALLHPLPCLQLLLLGHGGDLKVLLRVALEHAGADEVGRAGDGMHQALASLMMSLRVWML